MHVVVVGCGRVGSELASLLEKSGNTVAVLDKRESAFKRLDPDFGGDRIVGFGFDRDDLANAGIERAGALAAVTNGDNSNILTARIGRETFGVERVVARIYDPRRALIYQRLGIQTVATVSWTTDQVRRRLFPEQAEDWIDPTGKVSLVEVGITAGWVGKRLSDLNVPGSFVVSAVTRFGTAEVVTPELVGQEGDTLHVMSGVSALEDLRTRMEQGSEHQ